MRLFTVATLSVLSATFVIAQAPKEEGVVLPIVRAIVFKDGFAYTFREGSAEPKNGAVLLRVVPQAREGTLYAYLPDGKGTVKRLELRQVIVGERKERVERMFNDLYELLRQNEGKKVRIVTKDGERWEGILRVITPLHEDPSIPRDPQKSPSRVAYIALEGEMTALVRTDQIERLQFLEPATLKEVKETPMPLTAQWLAVLLDGVEDGKPVRLGVAALEAGLRWDATYRVVINERPVKTARLELVATIDNQLAPLKETTLLLAVGVPNFPYRMQLASLIAPSGYRREFGMAQAPAARTQIRGAPLAGGLGGLGERQAEFVAEAALPAEMELPSLEAAQLVFYETPPLDLKVGERASLVLFSQTLPCREVFEWTIDETPIPLPRPAGGEGRMPPIRPLATGFWYALALRNTLKVPLTTGIATAYQEWRPIGQGLLTFTAVGDEAILRLSPATEVVGDHEEREVSRTPVTEKRRADKAEETVQVGWTVTIEGMVKIRNTRDEPVAVIVRRTVTGEVLTVSDKGEVKVTPPLRAADRNPTSQIRWQLTVPSGEKTLTYRYRKFVPME
jgi:hypothetical protein